MIDTTSFFGGGVFGFCGRDMQGMYFFIFASNSNCESWTAKNWQKWKSIFLTCPCHEIYRIESGLKTSNYTLKIIFLWICEIWGNFMKNWYIVNNCLIKVRMKKILLHIYDTYNCDYLPYPVFRFYLIDFWQSTDFPSNLCIFYRKITQRYSKIGFSRKFF